MKYLLSYLLILNFFVSSLAALEFSQDLNDGWLYSDHTEGHWLDNHQGYSSLGVFLPIPFPASSKIMPFLDLRGHWFNNAQAAANFGTGIRIINQDASKLFGVNAFYDTRQVNWGNKISQLGLGFEVMGLMWEFRCNCYLPQGKRSVHSDIHFYDYDQGFKATCQQHRNSMSGFDAEIGLWIKKNSFFNLYSAIGYYSYFPKGNNKNLYGGQARLLAYIGRYVSLDMRGGYDQVSRGMVQGSIAISVPFGLFEDELRNQNLYYRPIYRQEIIALSKKDCCWQWNW